MANINFDYYGINETSFNDYIKDDIKNFRYTKDELTDVLQALDYLATDSGNHAAEGFIYSLMELIENIDL